MKLIAIPANEPVKLSVTFKDYQFNIKISNLAVLFKSVTPSHLARKQHTRTSHHFRSAVPESGLYMTRTLYECNADGLTSFGARILAILVLKIENYS